MACVVMTVSTRVASAQQNELPSPSRTLEAASQSEMIPLGPDPVSIEAGEVLEVSEPVPDDAAWWNPVDWLSGPTWEKGIELGINGSEGNAQAFSILTSGKLKRKTEVSEWGIDIVYGKTEADDVLTQHYAFFNSRADYNLGEGRWSLFNITRLEYDEFKEFDLRLAINGGVGYDILDGDCHKLTGRFGGGTSREFGGSDDDWVPEAVFGMDYEHELTEKQKVSVTSDYYPSWENFSDYRLVTQASWELILDEESNLSLKLGLLDRYDSTPMGRKANDVDYFVTLLWKL